MKKFLIFAVDESELPEGVEKLAEVIERQILYFAEEDSFNAFLAYIGDENPWWEIFQVTKSGLGEENPRKPFALWEGVNLDDEFKDLVGGLMNFHPA